MTRVLIVVGGHRKSRHSFPSAGHGIQNIELCLEAAVTDRIIRQTIDLWTGKRETRNTPPVGQLYNFIESMSNNQLILMEEITRRMMLAFKEVNELCQKALTTDASSRPSVQSIQQIEAAKEPVVVKEISQKDNRSAHGQEKKKEVPKGTPVVKIEPPTIAPMKNQKPTQPPAKDQKQTGKSTRSAAVRVRKGKAEVDPDLPKRPSSSYIMFQRDRKPSLQKLNPQLSLPDMAKELGKEWKKLDQQTKKKYEQEFNAAKLKYKKDMEDYKKKHPEYEEPKRKKKTTQKKESNDGEGEESNSSSILDVLGPGEKMEAEEQDSLGEM